jgi:hypothetical protein
VNGTEQKPRERLVAVPYALKAKQSEDAQKTDADLRKVVDALGKVVVAFGGNASNLVSNPTATIATMEKTVKDLLEMQKRYRVIAVSGNLAFGNSSTTQQLVISNTGFDRLTVSGITYPAGYSGNWSGTIAAGRSQYVTVTFLPTAAQAYSGNIAVASDAASGTGSIRLTGQGERRVELNGDMVFGTIGLNQPAQKSFEIRNRGTMDLTVAGIKYPAGYSGNWSGTIAAGRSQYVTVTFLPSQTGNFNGNITVNTNAPSGNSSLSVSGIAKNRIINLSGELKFYADFGTISSLTLSIKNTGTDILTVSRISYPADVSGSWEGGAIAPNATQNVIVSWHAIGNDTFNGEIEVISDATSGVSNPHIPISGRWTD